MPPKPHGSVTKFLCPRTEIYHHPKIDRIWGTNGRFWGSFKDPILSTPGWLYAQTKEAHGSLSKHRLPGA